MYTSIPYESGWTAYVDGKKTDITPIANNALVSIDLTAGTHTVEFKYIPKGFIPSVILFTAGILIFAAIIIFENLYLKKKKNRTLLQPIESTALKELVFYEDDDKINIASSKNKT